MPLIVEDGTGVLGANSFATLVQARDYATLRGVTLPIDSALTVFLVKATDYLKTLSYLGTQTYDGDGYLPFPRTQYDQYHNLVRPYDVVPQQVIDATAQLCIDQMNGIDLFPVGTGFAVKSEKIGPIETEYAAPTGSSNVLKVSIPAALALLKPFMGFRGIRVGRA